MTAANSRSPISAARSSSLAARLDLGQLLVDLEARSRGVGPVEADAGGPALDLLGALEGGEGEGDAGERAFVLVDLALRRLERLPARALRRLAEDMGMAPYHLGGNRRYDVSQVERAGLLGHARVIDDLELEVAELVLERLEIAAADRVVHLIGFLDRVGGDRLEALLDVPFTSRLRIAKPGHDRRQLGQRRGRRCLFRDRPGGRGEV